MGVGRRPPYRVRVLLCDCGDSCVVRVCGLSLNNVKLVPDMAAMQQFLDDNGYDLDT